VAQEEDAMPLRAPIRPFIGAWPAHQPDEHANTEFSPPQLETLQAHCKECIRLVAGVVCRWRFHVRLS